MARWAITHFLAENSYLFLFILAFQTIPFNWNKDLEKDVNVLESDLFEKAIDMLSKEEPPKRSKFCLHRFEEVVYAYIIANKRLDMQPLAVMMGYPCFELSSKYIELLNQRDIQNEFKQCIIFLG